MYIPSTGPVVCPYCTGKNIVSNGVKKGQIFVDIPHEDKPTFVAIDRHRYRCNSCRKTFLETFEGVVPGHTYTQRLVSYIEKQFFTKPLLQISKEVGLSEGTVRLIFNEYLARLEARFQPRTPVTLSLDVFTVIGKPRYFATNFKSHTVIGLMEDTSKESVENYLMNLKDKDKIIRVIMDINPPCINAVKRLLPDAKVVINPGYIINTILRILENMRVDLRKNLKPKDLRLLANDKLIIRKKPDELSAEERERLGVWEKRFPKLALGYWRKEELRKLFLDYSKKEAQDIFLAWQRNVFADGLNEYLPVIDSIFEWKDEVLGWFDITFNRKHIHYQYVEEMDEVIASRLRRGYSFEHIKARILSVRIIYPKEGVSMIGFHRLEMAKSI